MHIRKCWVDTCPSTASREQDKGVTFHKLPKNALLRTKWLLQAHLNEDTDKKWCFVCSRHFRKVDFEPYKASKFMLKADAIPTIFSWGITPLEELNIKFSSLTDSKILPDMSDSETNLTMDEKDKPDDSSLIEHIPMCETNEDVKSVNEKLDPSVSEHSERLNDLESISETKTNNSEDEHIPKSISDNSNDKNNDIEGPDSMDEIHRMPSNDKINIKEDIREDTLATQHNSTGTQNDLPQPEESIKVSTKEKGTKSFENTETEETNDQNNTVPEIESIFDNLFQKEKNDSNHDSDYRNKTSSDDDKQSTEKPPGNEILKEMIAKPMRPMVKPRVKLPVGRPRRRSPSRPKHPIPTKRKIDKSRKILNSSLSAEENPPNVSPKSEKGLLVQGSRVEARDFNEKWYQARVIEVDPIDQEVLIHYDNWSQRFDEWISMGSSRLRLVEGPPPTASATPPVYKIGERCLARWSNNQRFPATVNKVLQNGKYEVMFDDGFTRAMKWVMMSKIKKASHRRISAASSPNALSPVPYGARRDATVAVAPQATPPPPLHNHLFDPNRDHLGTKEERRDMKRRLNVKELFFARKKRKGVDKQVDEKKPLDENDGRRRKRKLKTLEEDDLKNNIGKKKFRRKSKNISKSSESDAPLSPNASNTVKTPKVTATVSDPISTSTDAAPKEPKIKPETKVSNKTPPASTDVSEVVKPIKSDLTVKSPASSPIPNTVPDNNLNKINTKSKSSAQHTTNVCKTSPAITNNSKISKHSLSSKTATHDASETPVVENATESESSQITSTISSPNPPIETENAPEPTPLVSNSAIPNASSNSIKKALLNTNPSSPVTHSEYLSNPTPSVSNLKTLIEKPRIEPHLFRAAEKDWCCHWINGQPVGTILDSEPTKDSSVSRVTVQVEDSRLPPKWTKLLTRRTFGKTEGKWDVVLVCPSGRRYRTRGEMQERLKEPDHDELVPYALGLMDFSAHRKQARRRGWDTAMPNSTTTSNLSQILNKPPEPTIAQNIITEFKLENNTNGQIPSTTFTPALSTEGLSIPCGENFVCIGSLKVEIIDNLLRCPKEGCFKNFRKENLLQMHIKHYHPELCKFFGDTPNVADLAYARTVVEEPPAPVIKPKEFDRTPGKPRDRKLLEYVKSEYDNVPIKMEPMDSDGIRQTPGLYDHHRTDNSFYGNTTASLLEDRNHHDDFSKPNFTSIKQEIYSPENKKYSNEDEYYLNQTWHVSKSKNVSKIKDPFLKTHPKYVSETSQSPKVYLPDDEYLPKKEVNQSFNKGYNYSAYRYSSMVPEGYRKTGKKRYLEGAEEYRLKKKKIPEHLEVWEYEETRSSFGVTERTIDKVPRNSIATNGRDIGHDMVRTKEEKDDSNQSTIVTETGEKIKIVHMKREEIINCHCGFGEEDGLMIQCELCLCWQHAMCHNIERESEVPEKYICLICLQPYRGRRSQKYLHDQDWLYEGRLPRANPQPLLIDAQRANMLRKSHELSANLLHIKDLMHSLRCKIHVSEKIDHPKLYLWSKPWDDNVESNKDCKNFKDGNNQNATAEIIVNEINTDIKPCFNNENSDSINNLKLEPTETLETVEESVQDLMNDVHNNEHSVLSSILDPLNEAKENLDELKNKIAEEDISKDGKCEMANGGSSNLFGNLLVSPGGTTLELPMTNSDLETLTKTVQDIAVLAPEPEAPIEPTECRVRLMTHVERMQILIDARLDSIEAQIAEMESQDPSFDDDDETPDNCPRTKQTIQMLLRDLQALEELGSIC